eukprot:11054194-Karenia_brevis.AAC.1
MLIIIMLIIIMFIIKNRMKVGSNSHCPRPWALGPPSTPLRNCSVPLAQSDNQQEQETDSSQQRR